MRRNVLYAVAFLSFSPFVLQTARQCIADEPAPTAQVNARFMEEQSGREKRSTESAVGTASQRAESMKLGLDLKKDSEGCVLANFYIHNRGKAGLLVCEKMQLSFSVVTANGRVAVPLDNADRDSNPLIFFYLAAPPPARAMGGITETTRRVRVPTFFFASLAGLNEVQRLAPETMKKAKLIGSMKGSVLKWNVTIGEYEKIPFEISSEPAPWEPFAHLFTAPAPSQKEGREKFKPAHRAEK